MLAKAQSLSAVFSRAARWGASSKPSDSKVRDAEQVCRKEIQALRLPSGLKSVAEIAEYVAAVRNRPIRLVSTPLAVYGVFGLWAMLEYEDIVFYERDTTAAHQEHIIAHELGHIVLDHAGDSFNTSLPFVHISSSLVERVLRRCGTQEGQEVEAEVFADLLSTFACPAASEETRAEEPDQVRRIFRSLGGR